MPRLTKAAFAAVALVTIPVPGLSREVSVSNSSDCEEFRILPNGREIRTKSVGGASASRGSSLRRSSSMSVRSRSGHSRSSASAFSSSSSASSSSGSKGTARAVSSVTDEDGRTVTTIHDEKGCRIVIDDR